MCHALYVAWRLREAWRFTLTFYLNLSDELFLFYLVEEKQPTTDEPPPSAPELSPLYIAMLCVGIPLIIVGVLAGAKRVYAKLWVPEGFPRHRPRRQPSTRRDPVGQEVSMR